ncbi:SlyX family protein [Gallaecimonas kandeliae]|uniref:SlyX family protein n=1 Tax=Gallaecimonas kandeliae TaxID=3029055 RepID=UPI002648B700|nr:SlyX family protein [Gallaecimonas kandeliae]WKE65188.1 SlyX family protein [Gallaecimonas kandeliae]
MTEDRFADLESRLAFQEAALHELSDEMAALQQIVEKQRQQLAQLARKMKGLHGSQVAGEHEETPPPHY